MENHRLLFKLRVRSKSEERKYYIMEIHSDGTIICCQEENPQAGCPAYEMKKVKACRHQKVVLQKLEALVERMKQKYI